MIARDGLPPATRRHLCICADDFGLAPDINDAILWLIDRGVVTATSCMVMRFAWACGARQLRKLPSGRVDLGLHLDLTHVDGSAREGSLSSLVLRSLSGRLERTQIAARIHEQLDRFEQALGRPPDHIDGHRHVHQLPVVRDMLIEAIGWRYGGRRPWLRSTRPAGGVLSTPPKHRLIHALGASALERDAGLHGIPMSRRLLGVYGFDASAERYRSRLGLWMRDCRDGDVLMCHPSRGPVEGDALSTARLQEFNALAALQRRTPLANGRVDILPLSSLLAHPWRAG